ncbi:TrmH family RNA methyltransferase [Trueperella pyogenes]|uniref:TrmH family RNA methyltransferase n=1 Tax=Trueperella pyogenes TaxID=1661 RepID=UPI000E1C1FED
MTDPHNLGAVMRSAAAFRADVSHPRTPHSLGQRNGVEGLRRRAARLPVARETNLVRSLKYLQEQGYFVVGLAGDGR